MTTKSSHTMLNEALELLHKCEALLAECERVAPHTPHRGEEDCPHVHCRTRREARVP